MNYVPFMVVASIHQEKNEPLRTYQHRHNDGLMPQPPLMPDPMGLLCHQVLSTLYRGSVWIAEMSGRTVLPDREVRSHMVTIEPKRQPPASAVAQQTHTEAIPTETEKKNVTRYHSRQLST